MTHPWALYAVAVLGAAAIYCLLPRRDRAAGRGAAALGGILALGAGAGLVIWLITKGPAGAWMDLAQPAVGPLFYVFALIALGTAIRVIVHPRPVYSALYFVMTVLAVAGLALLAGGEFLAVAIIIIYAGAILVVYVFVIMLAQQARSSGEDLAGSASYDVSSRPPLVPLAVGFLLLAAIAGPLCDKGNYPEPQQTVAADATPEQAAIAADSVASIAQELFGRHMLAVELAGVLLLVAIVGAVAIARKRVAAEDVLPEPEEATDG